MDAHAIEELAAHWRQGQRAFWSAQCGALSAAASAEAPAPAAFEGFWTELCGSAAPREDDESWRALAEAAARYRAVVLGAWQRVREAFESQRREMVVAGQPPPDWRAMRDRWLATAEAEFIRTQRSEAFLDAQRAALRAVVAWRVDLDDRQRTQIETTRDAARADTRLSTALGLEHVQIATTPKDVVWRAGKATLSRYRPLGTPPTLGPLLICYGLIGRQTMTDLTPDRSFVRNLLAAGVDVFVLDWGHPAREDAGNTFGHYACDLLGQALDATLGRSGADRAVLFGICQGGTMAACHAALHGHRLSGLVLAVTPIDFHADIHDPNPAHGLLNVWIRSLTVDDLHGMIALDGNLSGELMGVVFNQLNPVRTIAKYATELPAAAADARALATFLAMEKWLADRPDLPGALARSWLVDLYHRNALVAGHFSAGGAPVDLRRIAVPVLNVFATGDHIIPPPCSTALRQKVDARFYEELALPTGHVGVFVSASSQALLAPGIVSWLRRLH